MYESNNPLAAPIVRQVAILGDVVVGATVRGSYQYVNEAENPEEGSTYTWYVDGVALEETGIDLYLLESYADKRLIFQITARAASGEHAAPAASMAYLIETRVQNISEEENSNSFLKQRGNFSLYQSEPSDRIFTSTSGAFSLVDGRSQNVHVSGARDFGGVLPDELKQFLSNNPAVRLFSTERDFGALVRVAGDNNRLLLWGSNIGQLPGDLNNIKAVYTNRYALAWIYKDRTANQHRIGAVGHATYGGVVPDEIQTHLFFDPPRAIYAIEDAFAVLTEGGKVYAWGNPASGGTIGNITRQHLDRMNVNRIIGTAGAFCAIGPYIGEDEEVQHIATWGPRNSGGVLDAEHIEMLHDLDGVVEVIASRNAFCAITKRRGRLVTWGHASHGGVMSTAARELAARGNIVLCKASAWAFCMVNRFGQAEAWGAVGYGGNTPTGANVQSLDAGEALKLSGVKPKLEALFQRWAVDEDYQRRSEGKSVGLRGVDECGCPDRSSASRLISTEGTISLYANDSAFLLLAQDDYGLTHELFTWGYSASGGTMPQPVHQVLMGSLVNAVYCTNNSFAVIATQGSVTGAVTTWGATLAQNGAGQIPDALQPHVREGVVELYSVKQMPAYNVTSQVYQAAHAARRDDHKYVIWGAGNLIENGLLDPKQIETAQQGRHCPPNTDWSDWPGADPLPRKSRARPIATDVTIIGRPIVGGSVRGSYRYSHTPHFESRLEAGSIYRWTVDNEVVGTALDLKLVSDYANRTLRFSVIPRTAGGEVGLETFSAPVRMERGFQGISEEENSNSFLKQQGNFSFHVPEPADRIFASTGGAFAMIDGNTQSIYVEGQNDWGAAVPEPIKNFLVNNPGVVLYSTERDFGVLANIQGTPANQLLVWGSNMPTTLPPLRNIDAVYSNRNAFAFIYRNPTGAGPRIGAVGRVNDPSATVPPAILQALLFDAPKAIHATEDAFVVRTVSGKVYAWGNPRNGGSIAPNVQALLDGMVVEKIITGAFAVCAIGTNGELATWGSGPDGGDIPVDKYGEIIRDGGVETVIAATGAFCAITRRSRIAVSWGGPQVGGTMSPTAALLAAGGDIRICKANRWAFTMINGRGQAEAWGAPQYGGASLTQNVKNQIQSVFEGFAVEQGKTIIVPGALSLYYNDVSFFLLSRFPDGRTRAAIAWGSARHGGELPGPVQQVLMGSLVKDVYCTNGAYGAVLQQGDITGAVVVWGATLAMEDAGEIPPELAPYLSSNVTELYSIKRYPFWQNPPINPPHNDPSFAARRDDGTYVLWGGNVDNQFYDPANPAKHGKVKSRPTCLNG
ncbi:hypothetical protein ACIQUS_09610 [Pseudomonas sp. NPDC090755]|uniref:hypothetical protein n=1 Tax=Pseudomonas sp. NPDC090755 TaxID=3364481 RepID=UPI00383A339F